MKWILAILLLISAAAFGQDDTTKYISYPTQYGMKIPRMWAPTTMIMPYGDTTGKRPGKIGAFMTCTCDGNVYRWNGTNWVAFGGAGSATLSNAGSGYRLVKSSTGAIKTTFAGYGIIKDSTTNTDGITDRVDTSSTNHLVTQSDLNDTAAVLRAAIGTGGGGSGVTTMAAIGSSPNNNGASISGSTLTLQPANETYGGVLSNTTQNIKGNKAFIDKHTTINKLAPRLNAQTIPSTISSDSLYESGKYLGFGFIDNFSSGTIVQVHVKSDDHVGNNSYIKMRRSYDQGRTWTDKTIDSGATGYFVTGISGGVTHSNRLIVFLQHIASSDLSFQSQYIIYSDDEGETFSAPISISNNSLTTYQPYGPLCKIAGDSLLLSWYGGDGTTFSSYVIKSGDDGVTWSSPIPIVSNTTGKYTETSVMYLGGRTLIALCRSEVADTTYGQFISYNNGSSWTKQGVTPFGQSGTPAWTKTFKSKNGKRGVVAYYRRGPYTSAIKSITGWADSIVLGPQYWRLVEEKTVVPVMHGSGYFQACHPYGDEDAIATWYDETAFVEDATIKYMNLPVGEDQWGDKWHFVNGGINYYQGGFVGVNNSNPDVILDVKGHTDKSGSEETILSLFSSDASNANGAYFNSGNNATAGSRFFSIQAVEPGISMRSLSLNPSGGNVGIKTTSPLSQLHVVSASSGVGGYSMRIADNSITNGSSLLFNNTHESLKKAIWVDGNGLNLGNPPYDESTAPDPLLTLDNSTFGRVGVGVTSPLASIHIQGGSTFTGTAPIAIDSGALMTTPAAGRIEYNGHWWVTSSNAGVPLRTQIDGAAWSAATGGTNYAGGFVGINNSAPDAYLSLKGAQAKAGSEETVATFNTNDGSPLSLWVNMGNNATSGNRGIGLQGIESGVGYRPLWLNPDGSNVTIGTRTSTGAKLTVNGQATVTDDAYDATTWNGSNEVPTKNAIRDKIESMSSGGGVTLDAQYSDANNSGTSATDLYSKTIAANQLTTDGNSISFEAAGTFNDATATSSLSILFGGNSAGFIGSITSAGSWTIKCLIIKASSSTARIYSTIQTNGNTSITTANITGLDFTSTNILKITGTAGGAGGGSNDITATMWKVIYQP